jgi:hypothetical protein
MCTDRRYCCCNSALNPCGTDQDDDVPQLDVDDEQLGDGYSGLVIVRMSRELAAGEAKRHRGDAIGVAKKLFDRRFKRSHDGGMTGWRRSASAIIAVTLSVLLVGACSAELGNSAGPARSQALPPEPVSVQEYGTTLAGAVDPLESALKDLAKAKGYKGLERRVTAVETGAAQAVTELTQVTPPAELAGGHSQLVTALQAFHGELGNVSSQVGDRALCTGSAVRAGVGDADGTSALRDALAAVSAKLPDDPPALTLPSAGQKVGSRPPNGKLLRAGNTGGRSELTIENGGSHDAVVTLSKGRRPVISVYVRKDKTYTVKSVPDGSYTVFFTGGSGWDGTARAFGRGCAFKRYEDPLKFRTRQDAGGIYWQNWTITLQPVIGGTARTEDVNPDDFPDR